ncbi:8-oxo-dGTP pyrophosphatase MutT (NUDIX family) [Microbacterium endophyticum]|uniref:NUDIX hydrolase n=1 Tax=Microbacterium endophyticum TaxID=1526412 RepID=UPI0013EE1ED6|nr:NUDIX domain-containing protein [Microbacterium endophyticum]NIK36528.1 8-oxo-dGTP pyrophosphatase MutT (NUDIX family) [Microbacterium endophyticum]
MATPDFILELRRFVGNRPLSLSGVTAVIIRDESVLLGRRSDNGALTPITGIIDPGEEPAIAAAREALEEAGVTIRVDSLTWVHQIPRVTYENGDQTDYLDLTFRCTWLDGEPYPADGEMTSVGWFQLDELDELSGDMKQRIASAVDFRGTTRFETGS